MDKSNGTRQQLRGGRAAKARAMEEKARAMAAKAREELEDETESSFIAYTSFLQYADGLLLDEEHGMVDALEFLLAVFRYALLGEKPSGASPAAMNGWRMAKPQIDANSRRRTQGERGGRPKRPQGEQEEEMPPTDDEKTHGFRDENHGFSEKKPNVNVNVNENENENVNVNVNGGGASAPADQTQTQTQAFGSSPAKIAQADGERSKSEAEQMAALSISGPQTELAKQIHALYVSEGLPCEKAFPSFLQGGFTRALRVLHGQLRDYHVGSDALLAAVRNYASVVSDPGDYYDLRLPLDRLVAKPQFVDFLPASFVKANWRRRGTTAPAVDGADGAALGRPEWASGDPMWCPGCGQKAAYWYRAKMRYVCTSCKGEYDDDTTERLYRAKLREEEAAREKLSARP